MVRESGNRVWDLSSLYQLPKIIRIWKLWLPKSEQFELLLFEFQLFERYSRCAHQGPTLHRFSCQGGEKSLKS
ncbi:hypothetical protein L2E82_11210 [Cichorium intybus]|uniref:Uncharacterized protein n=2 Tax=Cichorium intybus TaxID=13427 RepID=A0ACB9GC98_CICIN|nr:hypothetical protein L2E82_11119 [Cichorium intybus]KAI3781203.1 hypothetical protein L2E82_11210 [Cichorium intybus]